MLHCTVPLIRSEIHNSGNVPLLVLSRTANQMNPVHATASCALKFHFSFIFPSTLRPSSGYFLQVFPPEPFFPLILSSTPSTRHILLHFITTNNIQLTLQNMNLAVMSRSAQSLHLYHVAVTQSNEYFTALFTHSKFYTRDR